LSRGVCASASSSSSAIVGFSSSRKRGRRWKPAAIASRREAEISAVSPVSAIQRWTSRFLSSSSATTVSESPMKSRMICFWSPRIRSTLRVSRRPGCARSRTSARSSGRPARPVPSSARISRRRSRYGRRITLPTRSAGTVEVVFWTVIGSSDSSSCWSLPGWQST
jgi:hypothetical protein